MSLNSDAAISKSLEIFGDDEDDDFGPVFYQRNARPEPADERAVVLTEFGIVIINMREYDPIRPLPFQPTSSSLKCPSDYPAYFPSKHKMLPPEFPRTTRYGSTKNLVAVTPGKIKRSSDVAVMQMMHDQEQQMKLNTLRYMKKFEKVEIIDDEDEKFKRQKASRKAKMEDALQQAVPVTKLSGVPFSTTSIQTTAISTCTSQKTILQQNIPVEPENVDEQESSDNNASPDEQWLNSQKRKLFEDWGRPGESPSTPFTISSSINSNSKEEEGWVDDVEEVRPTADKPSPSSSEKVSNEHLDQDDENNRSSNIELPTPSPIISFKIPAPSSSPPPVIKKTTKQSELPSAEHSKPQAPVFSFSIPKTAKNQSVRTVSESESVVEEAASILVVKKKPPVVLRPSTPLEDSNQAGGACVVSETQRQSEAGKSRARASVQQEEEDSAKVGHKNIFGPALADISSASALRQGQKQHQVELDAPLSSHYDILIQTNQSSVVEEENTTISPPLLMAEQPSIHDSPPLPRNAKDMAILLYNNSYEEEQNMRGGLYILQENQMEKVQAEEKIIDHSTTDVIMKELHPSLLQHPQEVSTIPSYPLEQANTEREPARQDSIASHDSSVDEANRSSQSKKYQKWRGARSSSAGSHGSEITESATKIDKVTNSKLTESPKTSTKKKKIGGFLNAMDMHSLEKSQASVSSALQEEGPTHEVEASHGSRFKDKLKGSFGNLTSAFGKKDKASKSSLKSALSSDQLTSSGVVDQSSKSISASTSALNELAAEDDGRISSVSAVVAFGYSAKQVATVNASNSILGLIKENNDAKEEFYEYATNKSELDMKSLSTSKSKDALKSIGGSVASNAALGLPEKKSLGSMNTISEPKPLADKRNSSAASGLFGFASRSFSALSKPATSATTTAVPMNESGSISSKITSQIEKGSPATNYEDSVLEEETKPSPAAKPLESVFKFSRPASPSKSPLKGKTVPAAAAEMEGELEKTSSPTIAAKSAATLSKQISPTKQEPPATQSPSQLSSSSTFPTSSSTTAAADNAEPQSSGPISKPTSSATFTRPGSGSPSKMISKSLAAEAAGFKFGTLKYTGKLEKAKPVAAEMEEQDQQRYSNDASVIGQRSGSTRENYSLQEEGESIIDIQLRMACQNRSASADDEDEQVGSSSPAAKIESSKGYEDEGNNDTNNSLMTGAEFTRTEAAVANSPTKSMSSMKSESPSRHVESLSNSSAVNSKTDQEDVFEVKSVKSIALNDSKSPTTDTIYNTSKSSINFAPPQPQANVDLTKISKTSRNRADLLASLVNDSGPTDSRATSAEADNVAGEDKINAENLEVATPQHSKSTNVDLERSGDQQESSKRVLDVEIIDDGKAQSPPMQSPASSSTQPTAASTIMAELQEKINQKNAPSSLSPPSLTTQSPPSPVLSTASTPIQPKLVLQSPLTESVPIVTPVPPVIFTSSTSVANNMSSGVVSPPPPQSQPKPPIASPFVKDNSLNLAVEPTRSSVASALSSLPPASNNRESVVTSKADTARRLSATIPKFVSGMSQCSSFNCIRDYSNIIFVHVVTS